MGNTYDLDPAKTRGVGGALKILVLTSTFPRHDNDTEPKFVDNLCRRLARKADVHVVAPHDAGLATEEPLTENIRISRFRYAPDRWEKLAYNGGILPNLRQNPIRLLLVPFFLLSQLLTVVRLLRHHDFDVVHAHWIIPQGIVIRMASALLRRPPPFVLTSHGGDLFALRGKQLGSLKAWVLGGAGAVTVVSSEMARKAHALGVPDGQLQVIPMGVDSQGTFTAPPADTIRQGLIFVGRLVDKKGVEYLLRAMPAVLDKYPAQTLTIVGDGPMRDTLESLTRELGISDSVKFTGALVNIDIPPLVQHSAVAIIPSVVADTGDQEGAPVSIMETLASACPTIVSDYPGARDIIEHGVNGLLVNQRSPDQIAERIIELLADAELRASIGAAGRRTILENFDWQIISDRFYQVFEAVADHR